MRLFQISLLALVLPLQIAGFVGISTPTRRCVVALQNSKMSDLFPVLSQIQGINWEGKCRYVNAELQPATNLKLTGGTRYNLVENECTLTSFLAFPDGRTRQVEMKGTRPVDTSRPNVSLRLDPTMEDGPIYMVLTELLPDTVLLNEIDKESGKIIMTSSISIVNSGQELVQISHEVGEDNVVPIEGHQVWRMKKSRVDYTTGLDGGEQDYRSATGQ